MNYLAFLRVRLKGLEPSRPKTPDPKSGASTNSATSAFCDIRSGWGNAAHGFENVPQR